MTRTTMMIIFGSVMTCITAGVHYYIWRRLVRDTQLPGVWRRLGTGLVVCLGLSIPVTMIFSRSFPGDTTRSLLHLPFVWMGMMMFLFCCLLAMDEVRLLAKLVRRIAFGKQATFDPGRRRTIRRMMAGGALLTVSGLAGAAVYKGKLKPVVKTLEVPLDRLPESMDGFRIVQLTDIHIGNTLDGDWLRAVVKQVNDLIPDLVVITGDVVDGYVETLRSQISSLGDIQAPHGVFLVTGNHEYFSGVEEWLRVFTELGIRVLRNQSVTIGEGNSAFALLGVDDFNAARMAPDHGPDLEKAVKTIPSHLETILLAHQPREIFAAEKQGIGLVISGHTHGGQVWPITHMVGLQQPYNKGLYRHNTRTQIYVSQGTGYWGPPMRLGTENEITEIRLRSVAKNA